MAPNCPPAVVASLVASVVVAAALAATLYTATTTTTSSPNTTSTTPPVTTTPSANYATPCGYCGPEISVTLRIEKVQGEDAFNLSQTVVSPQRELIYFLMEAADTNSEFRFAATYYPNLGFFIETLNGITPTDGSYWRLADINDVSLSLGVSSYKPNDTETVVFAYTTGGH